MKEIGGYIEFEEYNMPMLHEGAIALNSGRNCLAYLIRAKNIKKIKLPYFLCNSVRNLCEKEGTQVSFYRIGDDFRLKDIYLDNDEWLYVVNYYGQLTNTYIKELKARYSRVIIDQSQAYFELPVEGIDTLYTCRKFFGVSDGAFLYTDKLLEDEFDIDESFERMHFLLGRYEKTASEFYGEYVANNKLFATQPIKFMSKLTCNLLHGIDYEVIKQRRTENFSVLHERLKGYNRLDLQIPSGAFMYPLYHENASVIRSELQKRKIYIPILWPNVLTDVVEDDLEYLYAKNILPLPCDQRYKTEDMLYLVEKIEKIIDLGKHI
ncbi:MAG: hypothetical protein IJA07_07945 [Agathobacter sp.]|nr:hypothetical protein [Agathobacter sp.]